MAFKDVKVTLHHILNEATGADPGSELDELEVYGRFDVARLVFNPDIGEVVSLDSKNLFHRADDNAADIGQGTALIIDSSHQLRIHDGEFLQISGHLSERDTFGPNDQFGGMDFRFPLHRIRTEVLVEEDGHVLLFQESDQRVRVKISMVVTGQGS
jgi:hypothetical protein